MELPESVTAIGEQLDRGGAVVPAPELFAAYEVFAAEQAQIFLRPWVAVDHASRLAEDGHWLRFDVGHRSVVVARERADCLHAMRNVCLHAGYRICEDEEGQGERLFCPYHGWYYGLDGVLTDPLLRPDITDRSRYRLPRYAMRVENGLILVDLSVAAPEPPEAAPIARRLVPAALASGAVVERRRYPTNWNWKYLRAFLRRSPALFGDGDVVEFGPLSFLLSGRNEAVLLRIIPKFPAQSDFTLLRIALDGGGAAADRSEPIAQALRRTGDDIAATPLAWLERDFYAWYWPLMAAHAAA